MNQPETEPLLDIARGDLARSRVLRASLQILRDSSKDPAFQAMVDEIMAGRKSLREASRSAVFDENVADKAESGARWFRGLSEEERESLSEQGKEQMARLRAEIASCPDGPSASQDDDYEFDPKDPLRRRQERTVPLVQDGLDDDDYQFDPSDPLRRNR
jgi:hypothetical protein